MARVCLICRLAADNLWFKSNSAYVKDRCVETAGSVFSAQCLDNGTLTYAQWPDSELDKDKPCGDLADAEVVDAVGKDCESNFLYSYDCSGSFGRVLDNMVFFFLLAACLL